MVNTRWPPVPGPPAITYAAALHASLHSTTTFCAFAGNAMASADSATAPMRFVSVMRPPEWLSKEAGPRQGPGVRATTLRPDARASQGPLARVSAGDQLRPVPSLSAGF